MSNHLKLIESPQEEAAVEAPTPLKKRRVGAIVAAGALGASIFAGSMVAVVKVDAQNRPDFILNGSIKDRDQNVNLRGVIKLDCVERGMDDAQVNAETKLITVRPGNQALGRVVKIQLIPGADHCDDALESVHAHPETMFNGIKDSVSSVATTALGDGSNYMADAFDRDIDEATMRNVSVITIS